MTSLPIRVLLIEDNPGDARLLHEMLNEPGSIKSELTHFDCMNDSLTHLAANTANIILLDLGLPDADGLAAVRQVHAAAPSTPLVILTGLDDESLAVQALREGAQDYLVKGQIEVHALFRALRHAIERQRIQIETDQVGRRQLQLKDEFLSHVSHELCSPLDAIYQFGTILADQLANGAKTDPRECLEIMLRNVGQLQAMIGDMLEATRAQEGKLTIDLQCASVPDALAYTVKTLQEAAKAKGVVLSLDFSADLPLAYADPTRVRQILLILLDNAVKFTPSDGTITLRARLSSEDLGYLLIEVVDSGCGIDPDMTERIFERLDHGYPGNQTGRGGLGLGLYICKELITRQNGRIWVISSLQHGSTFSFTLPVFSLAGLLSPLLNHGAWPTDSVALVTVGIDSPGPMLSRRTRDEWSRDTRVLLQRCLLSDLDVLLPKMETSGPSELFKIVSFADERGVAVLTGRIRDQFHRLKHCQDSALSFSAVYELLEENSAGASAEDIAAGMAARIEVLTKSESTASMAGMSRQNNPTEETRI